MQSWVSLWSADLLDVGRAIDLVAPEANGFHLDIFDGHNVDELLFGPDFVSAVRRRTDLPLEVHLNVADPDHWAKRFIDVGADIVTVQMCASHDIRGTLTMIASEGATPSLGVELHDDVKESSLLAHVAKRYLMMGTQIGIKGVSQNASVTTRISDLRRCLEALGLERPIVVDGGIRESTIEALAAAGANGVVPGSLVFGSPDPCSVIKLIEGL